MALLGLALWVWREPVELWRLRQAPAAEVSAYAAQHPDSLDAARAAGAASLRDGHTPEAVELLTPAVERFPGDSRLRVLLARALLESGRLPEAYAQLQVVLSTVSPDDPDARWWLGQLLERTDRHSEAYDQYEALLRKQPKHAPALRRLGALSLRDGRFSAAEDALRRAVAADPRSAEAAAEYAEILFRRGKAEQAASEARRALQLEPHQRRASYWLGRSLLVLDARAHGPEAEAALRDVIRTGVDTAAARYFLAKLQQQQGRIAEAAQELRTNTREYPHHKDSFYDLALCERQLGHAAEATTAMRRFRELQAVEQASAQLEYRVWADPKDVSARLKLARFYLDKHRPDLARPQLEQVLRQAPGQPEARKLSARLPAE
jgi:tetratricopeptide (TPR) repeat protein